MTKKDYNKAYYQANKEKTKAYNKAYYQANKERRDAYDKEYREANKEQVKGFKIKHRYGVSLEEYNAVLSAGKCEVCGKDDDLVYHHDHGTMNAACLCRQCNAGIGLLGDDPYLLYKALKIQIRLRHSE